MKKLLFLAVALLTIATACIRVVPAEAPIAPKIPGASALSNKAPTASIDSILPATVSAGDAVEFKGHGSDPDGSIAGYAWRSSIDGPLSTSASFTSSALSVGGHIIYLKVQDNNGVWSEEVNGVVVVTAKVAKKPAINSFTASPSSVNLGTSSVLNWNVSGANVVTIDNGIGAVALIGSRAVSPGGTAYYTLTAMNEAGSTTAMVLVEVIAPLPPRLSLPVINFFVANPNAIWLGNASLLSWNVSNATTVYIEPDVGYVGPSGSVYVSPWVSATYRLTAVNAAGRVWHTVQIAVYAR